MACAHGKDRPLSISQEILIEMKRVRGENISASNHFLKEMSGLFGAIWGYLF